MEDARCVNRVRNCLGYTGTYKGRPVSVQGTGMGQPSLAIYVHELINFYGVRRLIRVGTCGGLSEKVKLRDVVLALTASTDSAMNRAVFGTIDYAPCADFGLLRAAAETAEAMGVRWHAGGIMSGDAFYKPDGLKSYEQLRAHGVLAAEMETSTLYTLAARFGVRAVSICTMTDSIISHEQLSAAERQSSLEDMARLALDVAVGEA